MWARRKRSDPISTFSILIGRVKERGGLRAEAAVVGKYFERLP